MDLTGIAVVLLAFNVLLHGFLMLINRGETAALAAKVKTLEDQVRK